MFFSFVSVRLYPKRKIKSFLHLHISSKLRLSYAQCFVQNFWDIVIKWSQSILIAATYLSVCSPPVNKTYNNFIFFGLVAQQFAIPKGWVWPISTSAYLSKMKGFNYEENNSAKVYKLIKFEHWSRWCGAAPDMTIWGSVSVVGPQVL